HLRHPGVPAARVPDPEIQRAVLFRRHVAADYRGRDHGFHVAGAGLHHDAPVRKPAEKGQFQGWGGVPHSLTANTEHWQKGAVATICPRKTLSRCRERSSTIFPTRPSRSSWRTAMWCLGTYPERCACTTSASCPVTR